MKDFCPAIEKMLEASRQTRPPPARWRVRARRRAYELLLFTTGFLAGLALCYQFTL